MIAYQRAGADVALDTVLNHLPHYNSHAFVYMLYLYIIGMEGKTINLI